MEYVSLIAALVGALIGSLSSIATLLIQTHYQSKREFKQLAIEMAMEDFKFRLENESDRIRPASAPVLIAYHDKIIDLVLKGQLTAERMREVLKVQADLNTAILEAYQDHTDTP